MLCFYSRFISQNNSVNISFHKALRSSSDVIWMYSGFECSHSDARPSNFMQIRIFVELSSRLYSALRYLTRSTHVLKVSMLPSKWSNNIATSHKLTVFWWFSFVLFTVIWFIRSEVSYAGNWNTVESHVSSSLSSFNESLDILSWKSGKSKLFDSILSSSL